MTFHWLHHLINPHCPECEIKPKCETCEVLKYQLALKTHECDRLLDSILAKPDAPENKIDLSQMKPIRTNAFIPWRVRREELEKNDRHAAMLKQKAPKPDVVREMNEEELKEMDELEKEVLNAKIARKGNATL
jgi:hypothetical protein